MIREIQKNDLEKVNLLLEKFSYSLTLEKFNQDFFKSLVYVDNEIHGVIVYNLIYDRIEIEYIIVSSKERRNGIGTKLLKSIENHNVKSISLEVRVSNIMAIEFYKKNGYAIKTIRKNYYNGEDAYLMVKELGE